MTDNAFFPNSQGLSYAISLLEKYWNQTLLLILLSFLNKSKKLNLMPYKGIGETKRLRHLLLLLSEGLAS